MNVLIIGGTGLISTGIVKHLLDRKAGVTCFNRGQRENRLDPAVKQVHGVREAGSLAKILAGQAFDVVIDMICYHPDQARDAIAAFAGKCGQYIFCSTVCSYGVKVPPGVLVDENFTQEPISKYGREKLQCEQLFLEAHAAKKFATTIIRPSHTYGPGNPLIDNLEGDGQSTWDRVERGLPVLCAGDGLGLWVSTHRDDCGKAFAYAAMNPKTFGQSYNATRDQNFTWRDYYAQAASVLGKKAKVLFVPAAWILKQELTRFGLLREITQFHGAYTSAKAKRDIPQFTCKIDFPTGVAETFADVRRRGKWKNGAEDATYNTLVEKALAAGIEPMEL
jgi:nucleoside-diphosphate-sugar epimerase